MPNNKESELSRSIKEKEEEKYSFYKLHEIIHIIVTLMNAYEKEEYDSIGKMQYGKTIIAAKNPTEDTKQLSIDNSLMSYIDLQLEYKMEDTLTLYGFGPRDSRFKLNIPENQNLDYIQDFADVLYLYRTEYEIEDLPYDEIDDLLKKYLEISKDEIEIRKQNKSIQKIKK